MPSMRDVDSDDGHCLIASPERSRVSSCVVSDEESITRPRPARNSCIDRRPSIVTPAISGRPAWSYSMCTLPNSPSARSLFLVRSMSSGSKTSPFRQAIRERTDASGTGTFSVILISPNFTR
jgi:hypothetical protein